MLLFKNLLQTLTERAELQQVDYLLTDMERALANTAETVFRAPVGFCVFHSTQAIIRRIREMGHAKLYERDEKFHFEANLREMDTCNYFPVGTRCYCVVFRTSRRYCQSIRQRTVEEEYSCATPVLRVLRGYFPSRR